VTKRCAEGRDAAGRTACGRHITDLGQPNQDETVVTMTKIREM